MAEIRKRKLSIAIERFPIAGRFTISRGAKTEAAVVTVTITEDDRIGQGECVPYGRYGETLEGVAQSIESARASIERGMGRAELQRIFPAGAARNALDCALWDLEAKLSGTPAYVSANVPALRPVVTAFTLSLDSAEAMGDAAKRASDRPVLKIKLGAKDGDLERIAAVRKGAPNAAIIADANEGWTEANLAQNLEACANAGFALIEQPLPADRDEYLRTFRADKSAAKNKVPLCADESVHDRASLERLVGLYDCVNIKLDKTGGLTEALLLADSAQAKGFGLMIGCMVGTSLAMAPGLVLAPRAKFVDLDGPLLLARDRENPLKYEGSIVHPSQTWGMPVVGRVNATSGSGRNADKA